MRESARDVSRRPGYKEKVLRMESRFQIAKILAFSSAVNPQPTLPTFCQHKQLEPGCSVVSSLKRWETSTAGGDACRTLSLD